MLSVGVKSTDTELTTTGALKQRLFGTTVGRTSEDAVLNAMIKAASRWAETYVGYPLTLQTYEETVASFGTRRLMLGRYPVRSLRLFESTEDDALEITSTQARLDREAAILERDDGWPWTAPTELELEERPVPGEETQPWFARYQAGYVHGGLSTESAHYSTQNGTTDTGRTLPEDIEEAVLVKCRSIYEQSVEGHGATLSETLGDLSVTYRSDGGDRASGQAGAFEELLLEPYRRVV